MTKCQRSIDKMGQVGKKIWETVCNRLYGSFHKDENEAIKPISSDGSLLDQEGLQDQLGLPEETGEVIDAIPNPKVEEAEEAEEKEEEKEEARDITNQQATTARKAAYQAAINAGVTPAQAQAAADAQTPAGNYAGNYAALAGAGANARAAYRERQGYADALERETKNLEESRTREIIAAALSGAGGGAGAGAQTGISLF